MANTINATSTGAGGLITTGDDSGVLNIQTNETTAITVDASQNVGVGVTPSAWSGGYKSLDITSGASFFGYPTSYAGVATNAVNNGGWKYRNTAAAVLYQQEINSHVWYTAASGTAGNAITFTQAMTLDASGNLLVGATVIDPSTNAFTFQPSSKYGVFSHATGTSSGTVFTYFSYAGSAIGSVSQNGTTGVLYNLTSDYRLKNDQQALTGAKDFIMALKPKKWQWWDGSGEGVGFVAHEFMEVAKHSGHGEKDAVDADGKPKYQSIQPSSSEVMANLVSFIQEQQALITQLQADVAALKGA